MASNRSPQLTGVEVRHGQGCRLEETGRCNCDPRYRGRIAAGRSRRVNGPWTRSLAEARSWRTITLAKLERGEEESETRSRRTVAEAADEWSEGVRTGAVRNRSGRPYKPSSARALEAALRPRVVPTFGRERLSDIDRPRLQRWVRSLIADDLDASTVRNTLVSLRVLYREAIDAGEAKVNPTHGLKLPAYERHEPRFVPPETAAAMLDALPLDDRAIWASAFYAGSGAASCGRSGGRT